MGLFDKKFCDVCGEKIGMLGNRKLEDGNICKDCAKKLSPWFDDRRHSTLEEIKSQLQMREENRSLVSSFRPGRVIRSDRYNLYIDERQQLFAASVNLDREDNPDIISLSQITGCNLDVDEMRTEEYRTDRDGERESYNPPRYSYSYDYYFYIYLNHPYIHEMKLKLNSMDISEDDRNRRHEMCIRDRLWMMRSIIYVHCCDRSFTWGSSSRGAFRSEGVCSTVPSADI